MSCIIFSVSNKKNYIEMIGVAKTKLECVNIGNKWLLDTLQKQYDITIQLCLEDFNKKELNYLKTLGNLYNVDIEKFSILNIHHELYGVTIIRNALELVILELNDIDLNNVDSSYEQESEQESEQKQDIKWYPGFIASWLEYERGWGTRPDGISIHTSKENMEKLNERYGNKNQVKVPEYYSVISSVNKVNISPSLWKELNEIEQKNAFLWFDKEKHVLSNTYDQEYYLTYKEEFNK